ncbi:TIGR04222 domain-containing membrane protein [Streptomyces qinzhouensis]|uniref:TIGR04222 domain-containing membrane protein n=1 Tax=Streptomyces qinzhouensis TaxID=2599401 RepID=A0A5B8ILY3_9ACTN|nr:TIGR04222 domain-containing membrane protein [Streptomyces qinzhouensis]QDY79582.1 TIGR04222 domain-containing membrane protein [Streptomyces qinzhouensis]
MAIGTVAVLVNAVAGVLTVWLIAEAVVSRRRHKQGDGRQVKIDDPYQAAFLSGGPLRAVDAALATMSADGRIRIIEPGIVIVERPEGQDAVERALLTAAGQAPNGALNTLRHTAARSEAVQRIGHGLARSGLLVAMSRDLRVLTRWARVQKILFLLAIPAAAFVTPLVNDGGWTPVGDLFLVRVGPGLLLAAWLSAGVGWNVGDRLTGNGGRALSMHRSEHKDPGTPAERVATMGLGGVQDSTVRAVMIAAATTAFVAVAAGPALAGEQVSWCGGGGSATSCGGSQDDRGGSSCGDGGSCSGGGDGGGCGGCGGCGCG